MLLSIKEFLRITTRDTTQLNVYLCLFLFYQCYIWTLCELYFATAGSQTIKQCCWCWI